MSEHRLIYADELYDTLANKLTWLMMKYGDEVYLEVGKDIREAINEQPTYDIDDVVEQLEYHAIEFEAFGQCSDYVELSHAIEIVKKGGGTDE